MIFGKIIFLSSFMYSAYYSQSKPSNLQTRNAPSYHRSYHDPSYYSHSSSEEHYYEPYYHHDHHHDHHDPSSYHHHDHHDPSSYHHHDHHDPSSYHHHDHHDPSNYHHHDHYDPSNDHQTHHDSFHNQHDDYPYYNHHSDPHQGYHPHHQFYNKDRHHGNSGYDEPQKWKFDYGQPDNNTSITGKPTEADVPQNNANSTTEIPVVEKNSKADQNNSATTQPSSSALPPVSTDVDDKSIVKEEEEKEEEEEEGKLALDEGPGPLNTNDTSAKEKLRISQTKCSEYSECEEPKNTVFVAVIGGEPADVGEFPHMALLGWRKVENGSNYLWLCGGSLISEWYVLTAAHCTFTRTDGVMTPTPNIVRLGELDLTQEDEGTVIQDIDIANITDHPEYSVASKYNDISLLRLAQSVIFSQFVRPLCLWQNNKNPNGLGIATGWGRTNYTGSASDILLKVSLALFDQEECQMLHSFNSKVLKRGIIEEQICAGSDWGEKDTCQGDSGGPLVSKDLNKRCVFHQIGITSFGIGCGNPIPGVYTRVSRYLDWIEPIVWPQ